MEWVETTGPTLAAAREAALDELGVDERDAELVVVAEPKSGLFGFGRVEARVRARVRPAPPRPKRPQRRRGDDRSRGRGGDRRTADGDGEGVRDGSRTGGRGRSGRAPSEVPAEVPAEQAPGQGRRRRRSGGRGEDGRQDGAAGERAPRTRAVATSGEAEMTIEQQAAAVEQFVSGVVERFGFDDARTTVRVEEDHVLVDVSGAELGLLIGPRGRTLDALQELARTVVQRRGDEGGARVVVDVSGFRAKRAAALESFARRVAAEVIDEGDARPLEPMNPADRKLVHDVVTTIEGVHTSSEGAEPHRYVVIHPGSAGAPGHADDD